MLSLRILEDADAGLLEKWLDAPHVRPWFEHPANWLEEVRLRNIDYRFIRHFIAMEAGTPIGFCQYYVYRDGGETWHGTADVEGAYSIDYLIGEAPYLGRGLGKQLIRALIEKIRRTDDAMQIIVQPDPNNQASRAALRACGFDYVEEGAFFHLGLR